MADTLYIPEFKVLINTFDVTETIRPYLLSINIDDTFDTEFSVSRLELLFHAKYLRNSSWQYKDKLQVEFWWKPYPTFKYISPVFYVDYIDDLKSSGGNQTYRISALEADPELGFKYSENEIVFNNKTIKNALIEFSALFGLTLAENTLPDIYMGTVETNDINNSKISFNSYAEMLKYICNEYGYLGKLEGKNLKIEQINSNFSSGNRFFIWDMPDVIDVSYKSTYNNLYKSYLTDVINRDSGNVLLQLLLQPEMQAQLNNKEVYLDDGKAQYNRITGEAKLYGRMYQDFLSGFEIIINCSALPEFKAGYVFLLNSSYGNKEGYYRCTKVNHRIDANGWISEVTGFPLKMLLQRTATFDIGYYGQTTIPSDPTKTFKLSQNIKGQTFVLAANKFDGFAKYLNPNYTINIGNLFLAEGNKSGNNIKPDLAFCLCLLQSRNFTDTEIITKKNPLGIATSPNPNILATFSTWELGVRAAIQHLFAYSTPTGNPADAIVDPRYGFVSRGIAPTYDDLNGRLTESLDIGERVKSKAIEFYNHAYPTHITTFID